jgi:hypothetical protein
MSRATYPLKLPASIKAAAARLAKEDGVSLNQWIATAVAQKVGVVETAAAFFRQRAERAKPDELERIMQRVPDVPVEPEEMIPPDLGQAPFAFEVRRSTAWRRGRPASDCEGNVPYRSRRRSTSRWATLGAHLGQF